MNARILFTTGALTLSLGALPATYAMVDLRGCAELVDNAVEYLNQDGVTFVTDLSGFVDRSIDGRVLGIAIDPPSHTTHGESAVHLRVSRNGEATEFTLRGKLRLHPLRVTYTYPRVTERKAVSEYIQAEPLESVAHKREAGFFGTVGQAVSHRLGSWLRSQKREMDQQAALNGAAPRAESNRLRVSVTYLIEGDKLLKLNLVEEISTSSGKWETRRTWDF